MTKEMEEQIDDLSHEIRNALSCIFQFANILRGGLAGEVSGEQREFLGIMITNASRIRSALDELAEVAATGLGRGADSLEVVPKKVD